MSLTVSYGLLSDLVLDSDWTFACDPLINDLPFISKPTPTTIQMLPPSYRCSRMVFLVICSKIYNRSLLCACNWLAYENCNVILCVSLLARIGAPRLTCHTGKFYCTPRALPLVGLMPYNPGIGRLDLVSAHLLPRLTLTLFQVSWHRQRPQLPTLPRYRPRLFW